ncbi:MAG TPA: hypothetical protein VNT24_07645 [Propionibacteriaceae bacterium]|nr:hypothetical protein [Propionibacteriaceae bacterium]
MRRIMKLGALALGLLVPLGAATAAQAAEPVPFTITEQVNFVTGDFTFTATGPLCPSGTFVDDVTVVAPNPESSGIESKGGLNLLIRTVYTCDDGSGTFNALKHVLLTFSDDDRFTNTGPIQLLGGTGAYTGLVGHGVDNGFGQGDVFGVGQISGFVVVQGPGT